MMFLVFTIVCTSVVIRLLIFPIKFLPEDDAVIDWFVSDTAASGTTVLVLSSSAMLVAEALAVVMLVFDAAGAAGAKPPECVALVMRMRNACSKMS